MDQPEPSSPILHDEREKLIEKDQETKKPSMVIRVFRYLNLIRALGMSAYSFYLAYNGYLNDIYIAMGAQAMFVATMIALSLDALFALLKAFPWILQKFKQDRFRSATLTGVWMFILDQEMVMDLLTPLMNLYLKVYSYRLAEWVLLKDDAIGLTNAPQITSSQDIANPKNSNFILLMLFGVTLVLTIIMNTIRIAGMLWKQKSKMLGMIIILKGFLLSFDLIVNALLLYETLVTKGKDIFVRDETNNLTLSIVVTSPWVTLLANSVVNLPLHYFYLELKKRMALSAQSSIPSQPVKVESLEEPSTVTAAAQVTPMKETMERRVEKSHETLSHSSLFLLAAKNTFYWPIVLIFNGYAIYSVIALYLLIGRIRQVNPLDSNAPISASKFSGNELVVGLVWVNLFANYAFGIIAAVGYWLFQCGRFINKLARNHKSATKPKETKVEPVEPKLEDGNHTRQIDQAPQPQVRKSQNSIVPPKKKGKVDPNDLF